MSFFEQKITVYVNIAPTLRFGGVTGIQRVVRKLFDELHQKTLGNLTFVFGANTAKGWYTASADDLMLDDSLVEKQLGQLTLFQRLPYPLKSVLRTVFRRYFAKDSFASKSLITLPKDAWLLELDTPWIDDWRCYPKFRNTINLIYDVTPLSHREYCQPEASFLFTKWLKHNLPNSRGIISISKTALAGIISTLQQHSIALPPSRNFFYLGANFTNALLPLSQNAEPYFLFVGSIAPQKNISLLLDAYEIYRAKGGNWPLVILGRSAGFKVLDERLIRLKCLGLLWLSHADDSCLERTYNDCAVVIAPSIWEGFGLPLVEALLYKKIVIASNIEVYKELAAEAVNFFDVEDAGSLVKQLQRAEQGALMSSQNSFVPGLINWQQSAGLFANAVLQLIKEISQREHYS